MEGDFGPRTYLLNKFKQLMGSNFRLTPPQGKQHQVGGSIVGSTNSLGVNESRIRK